MKYLIPIVFLLLLSSCQKSPFFSETADIDPLGWTYNNKLSFEVEVSDTIPYYNMHLNVGHNTSYSYQNIYMKVSTAFPNREEKVEQLNIDLAEKNGQWIGKCSGESCQVKVYLLEKFKFAEPGTYTFTFEQYSRDNPLIGVEGLQLDILEFRD